MLKKTVLVFLSSSQQKSLALLFVCSKNMSKSKELTFSKGCLEYKDECLEYNKVERDYFTGRNKQKII